MQKRHGCNTHGTQMPAQWELFLLCIALLKKQRMNTQIPGSNKKKNAACITGNSGVYCACIVCVCGNGTREQKTLETQEQNHNINRGRAVGVHFIPYND